MDGGGFLSQGGYGCVFYPEVTCSGKDTNNKNFLSKIVERDYNSKNEIEIGKILHKKMKNWIEKPLENYFAPIVSHCDVDVDKFKIEEQDKCNLFEKQKQSDFVLMKIRYIGGGEIDNFIVQNNNNSLIMLMFTSSYTHMLKSLQMLINAKICHFDIKAANVVYDDVKSLPIIIDFGLSIDFENINMKELYNYFYIFETMYYVWPLEVHLINYILHVNSDITEEEMKKLARDYTRNNTVLRVFSPEFIKNFEDECYHELKKYVGKDSNAIIQRILKYWPTWDNYALSLLYIKLIYYVIRNDEGEIIKNKFVSFFVELCLKNIHPNPKKRLMIEQTLKSFNLFLFNQQIDKDVMFEEIMEQIDKNKEVIGDAFKKDKAHMTLLSEKIKVSGR